MKICVFCGSNTGFNSVYLEEVRNLGKYLAENNITVVYGGGSVGLMGELADSTLKYGGKVIGVYPKFLVEKEVCHKNLTETIEVESMHERKAKMAELADAFLALPGGLGTFEEFFEVLTWLQLGLHTKPCAVLNVNQYYDLLQHLLHNSCEEGFIKSSHVSMIIFESNIPDLIDKVLKFKVQHVDKWFRPELT